MTGLALRLSAAPPSRHVCRGRTGETPRIGPPASKPPPPLRGSRSRGLLRETAVTGLVMRQSIFARGVMGQSHGRTPRWVMTGLDQVGVGRRRLMTMSSGSDRGCGRFRRSRVARLCAGRECRHHDQRNARGPAGREVEHADERRDVDFRHGRSGGQRHDRRGHRGDDGDGARPTPRRTPIPGRRRRRSRCHRRCRRRGYGRVDGRGQRARRRDVDRQSRSRARSTT